MSSEVRSTIGAALAGCFAAVGLSAVLGFQTFLYFHIFPSDALRYKILVAWIWLTDAVHTVFICTAVWQYTVVNFANPLIIEKIFPVVALTVALTAIITLSVNIFYGWRIYKLSKQNWWLTGPIILLSVARVGLAFTTTTEMLLMKTFPAFAARFKILFTSGLFISALTDIVVSTARYYFLRGLKDGYSPTQEMVDSVVVFTINDGLLTCAVVIASIACWLSMPHNFVYLGIYFTIAKLYSNSTLATLNLRNWFRHRYAWPRPMGIPLSRTGASNGVVHVNDRHHPPSLSAPNGSDSPSALKHSEARDADRLPSRMEVYVDHQVEYNVGNLLEGDLEVENHLRQEAKLSNIA